MMEGIQFYRTVEFVETGSIPSRSTEEWTGRYNISAAPISPQRTDCSYISCPSRLRRLNQKSIRFFSNGHMTSGTGHNGHKIKNVLIKNYQ